MSTHNKEAAEHAAFERWARTARHPEGGYKLARTPSGSAYIDPETRCTLRGWLARSALTASAAPVTEQAPCTHPPGCTFCAWCGFRSEQAPKCGTCKGAGQVCIGTSGDEWDGNAPVLERCGECGYGEQAPAGEVPSDELRTEEAAIVGFLHQNDGHTTYLNLTRDSTADHSEALMTVAQHKRIIVALSTPPAVPQSVLQAVKRMSNPLDYSRLSGVTAREDARCMKIISDFIGSLSAAPAAPQGEQPPCGQVVAVEPSDADGPGVNWLGAPPKVGTLLYTMERE